MEPTENSTPTESPDQSQEQPISIRRIEPNEPELTAQVDDLMATSSASNVPAQAPEATIPSPQPTPEVPTSAESVTASAPVASVLPAEAEPAVAQPQPQPQPLTPKRSMKKPLMIVVAAFVVLAAAAGAAYAEVIVPNKPTNVLMSALDNSLQTKQLSYKGTINVESSGTAVKVGVTGSQDNTKQASDITLNVTASGITLPVEARLVDKNIYVKVGDLGSISSLIGAYGGSETTKLVTTLNQQLSNKWISIDSTLLKTAGASCFVDTNFSLTKADVQMIEDQYKQQPFATVQSSASDTVNGKKVEKYVLSIDDDKAAKYGNSLNNLSLVKAANACDTSSTKSTSKAVGDHDKTPLTVWVDKSSKQIVQIASHSTAADAKKGTTGDGQITFSYAPVSISAPTDSTPALEVFSNLEKALGIPAGGDATSGLTGLLSGLGASALLR